MTPHRSQFAQRKFPRQWVAVGATVATIALVPLVVDSFWLQLLTLGGILAILTIGFNLTFGVAGQINLAMGGFMAIGAYSSALLTTKTSWPAMLGALVGLAIAGVVAYVIGWPTSRLRGLYIAMATVAVQLAIVAFLVNARWLTNGPIGVFNIRRPVVFGLTLTTETAYFYLVLVVSLLVFLAVRALLKSRIGRGFEAIREDEEAARSLGIHVARLKVHAFVIGALCASIAGSLYAHFIRFVSPESFDITRSMQVLGMAVVGGLGSNIGAVIGAVVVIVIPEYVRRLLPNALPNIGLYQSLIYGTAMLIVLLFAPGGITGTFASMRERVRSLVGRVPVAAKRVVHGKSHGKTESKASSLHGSEPTQSDATMAAIVPEAEKMIVLSGVTKHFDGLTALDQVSFEVPRGSLFGLIGPNGSGKTTLFNVVGGQLSPDGGRVMFEGRDVTHATPEQIAELGISRTFQIPRLFKRLTVRQNVLAATHLRGTAGTVRCMFRIPSIRHEEQAVAEITDEILEFAGLAAVADKPAAELSSGQARLLEISRALAVAPRLLMLDEPAAGLSHSEIDVLIEKIRSLRERGITVLLVEHNMSFVMTLCERLVVLSEGVKIGEGTPSEIRADARVIDAYLGRS